MGLASQGGTPEQAKAAAKISWIGAWNGFFPGKIRPHVMSKAYLVKISDYSQAFADSGIDFRVVVELPDQALQRLAKYYGYHIERAKRVARDTVNQRWQKIRPGASPIAMRHVAVENFSGDLSTSPTPGYKPYESVYGERGWLVHGPIALAMPPDESV
jgi:hypothetical protein